MKKKILIISGPTASGKTNTSILISKFLKKQGDLVPQVVNFDSLLFYKELNIGTAKPTSKEIEGINHYLIDEVSAKANFDASDFIQKAKDLIETFDSKKDIVILVGGSGFYLRALIKGMYETESPTPELKLEIENLLKEKGIAPFINFLNENDPESMKNLHENDHYRITRAYEFFKITGKKISESKKKMDEVNPYDFQKPANENWDLLHIYLDMPKDEHYEIITKRTQSMIDSGLINEVKELLKNGFTGQEKALRSIGYKEVIDYLNGELKTEEALMERISISTRQLAKSQRTFFKKVTPKETFHPLNDQNKIQEIVKRFIT